MSNIVRWQRQLEFFIASLTGKPCSNLEPALQAILRLGVYEVVHQNLSAHVISEHVDLAKKLVRPAAGKLVNGESLVRNSDEYIPGLQYQTAHQCCGIKHIGSVSAHP